VGAEVAGVADVGSESPVETTTGAEPVAEERIEAQPETAQVPAEVVAAVTPRRKSPVPITTELYDDDIPMDEFLLEARALLLSERENYTRQAEELKAAADALAFEHEPGDDQFDEEGGEGGTSNVDRELDLLLSAQARAAVAEIDRALTKIDQGTYGNCEQCGRAIPQARLRALPYAALCVACKSGGLGSRR
jgi:DnaK suppressor protein